MRAAKPDKTGTQILDVAGVKVKGKGLNAVLIEVG
jgi:hypothetical protein